ncbi:MAG: hypothetical protein WB586_08290 [Chthoniobacterales bacterium]
MNREHSFTNHLDEVRQVVERMAQRWNCGYERRALLVIAADEEMLATIADELDTRAATPARVAMIVFAHWSPNLCK